MLKNNSDCSSKILNLDNKFIHWFRVPENRKKFVENLKYTNYKKDGIILNDFTSVKENNCLYLQNKDLLIWVKEILTQTNFASIDSYRSILEIRGGEYSNGTLYSSSRFAFELFSKKNIVKSLLKQCFNKNSNILSLLNKDSNIKVHLEKLFYFTLIKQDGNKYSNPAHLDVCIEIYDENTLKAILAVECKVKEIYAPHQPIFSSTYIKKFKDMNLKFDTTNNSKEILLTEFELRESRFEFKQQLCHYLGLVAFKNKHKNVIVKFTNFILNPSLFDMDIDIIKAYNEWLSDSESVSKAIINKLKIEGKVDYCGSFFPNFKLGCEKAVKIKLD